jgi:hypothetical protein
MKMTEKCELVVYYEKQIKKLNQELIDIDIVQARFPEMNTPILKKIKQEIETEYNHTQEKLHDTKISCEELKKIIFIK